MNSLNQFIHFIATHQQELADQTAEHVLLTAIALTIAVLVGLPAGIALTRLRRFSDPILGGIGVIQTIPSIALLGFLLPFLGIGAIPAIVALFLYALLPIVRNAYTGIEEVDPSIKEAARGMGMSDRQMLFNVELPLAVPVIFAGIRTATVINVGIATLCALIGSGGLGEFIFRGIALNNMNMILAGAIPAAALALILDFMLGRLQRIIGTIIKPVMIACVVLVGLAIPIAVGTLFSQDDFRAGFTAEFMERHDGYPGLKKHYDFSLKTVELDPGLMYQALRRDKVDVIAGFSTDGRVEAYTLTILQDDRNYFPPYQAAPLVRKDVLQKYPAVRAALNRLKGRITNEIMSSLNYRVDYGKEDPEAVARDFLEKAGFSINEPSSGDADLVIGSKNFTEQYILAHLFALIVESHTGLTVDVKTGLAGTNICFEALVNGEIDLYPEYTGTGFLVLLHPSEELRNQIIRDEHAVYEHVRTAFKDQFGLEWLPPLGFNNTYALMMRANDAEKFNISTITDLRNYVTRLDGTD